MGKEVAILTEGKEHLRRYTHKEAGGDPAAFFGKVVVPANSEAALDSVLLGSVQAALVDRASLDIYREVNPGKCQRLKIIGESAAFPPAVVALKSQESQWYHRGAVQTRNAESQSIAQMPRQHGELQDHRIRCGANGVRAEPRADT